MVVACKLSHAICTSQLQFNGEVGQLVDDIELRNKAVVEKPVRAGSLAVITGDVSLCALILISLARGL